MAKKKAPRTPKSELQREIEREYMRERKAAQNRLYRARRAGHSTATSDRLPPIPKKITGGSIRRLKQHWGSQGLINQYVRDWEKEERLEAERMNLSKAIGDLSSMAYSYLNDFVDPGSEEDEAVKRLEDIWDTVYNQMSGSVVRAGFVLEASAAAEKLNQWLQVMIDRYGREGFGRMLLENKDAAEELENLGQYFDSNDERLTNNIIHFMRAIGMDEETIESIINALDVALDPSVQAFNSSLNRATGKSYENKIGSGFRGRL